METTTTTTPEEAAQFALANIDDSAALYLRVRTENLNVLLWLSDISPTFLTGREVTRDSDGFMNVTDRLHLIDWTFVRWVKVIACDYKYNELTTVMEGK